MSRWITYSTYVAGAHVFQLCRHLGAQTGHPDRFVAVMRAWGVNPDPHLLTNIPLGQLQTWKGVERHIIFL